MELSFIVQILLGYSFIGFGLKYVDQAYDINVFSKKIAMLIAILTAAVMSYLSIIDVYSAMIFISLVVGMIIIRRVDNIAFVLGAAIVGALFLLFGSVFSFNWILFLVLLLSHSFEEIISDYGEKKKFKGAKHFLMHYGIQIKLVILALAVFGYLNFIYFVAFFLLDLFYLIIEWYSIKRLGYYEQRKSN